MALRRELSRALSRGQLQNLHRKDAARHLLIAVRQFAMLGLATWGLVASTNPLVWIPLVFVQGFTIFNFTVLLHEVVHHLIFERRHPAGTQDKASVIADAGSLIVGLVPVRDYRRPVISWKNASFEGARPRKCFTWFISSSCPPCARIELR